VFKLRRFCASKVPSAALQWAGRAPPNSTRPLLSLYLPVVPASPCHHTGTPPDDNSSAITTRTGPCHPLCYPTHQVQAIYASSVVIDISIAWKVGPQCCWCFTCSTMLLYLACASAAVAPATPNRSSRRRSRGRNCSSLSGYTTCQLGRGMSRYTWGDNGAEGEGGYNVQREVVWRC